MLFRSQAINLIIEKGEIGEIYNVANGEKVYLREALDYVKEKVNSTSKFNSIDVVPFHKITQTRNMVLDITKLKKLGYTPKYSTKTMLDTII